MNMKDLLKKFANFYVLLIINPIIISGSALSFELQDNSKDFNLYIKTGASALSIKRGLNGIGNINGSSYNNGYQNIPAIEFGSQGEVDSYLRFASDGADLLTQWTTPF